MFINQQHMKNTMAYRFKHWILQREKIRDEELNSLESVFEFLEGIPKGSSLHLGTRHVEGSEFRTVQNKPDDLIRYIRRHMDKKGHTYTGRHLAYSNGKKEWHYIQLQAILKRGGPKPIHEMDTYAIVGRAPSS